MSTDILGIIHSSQKERMTDDNSKTTPSADDATSETTKSLLSSSKETIMAASPIVLPEREYGYQEIPFSWEDLKQIILVEQNLAKLSRSTAQQMDYERFRRRLNQEWRSIYDYILCTKLGFSESATSTKDEDGGSTQRCCDIELEHISEVRTALVENDFPYNMEPGIEHLILWKTKENITPHEIQETLRSLQDRENVVDTLHWINPPHLKSLPGIDHVHFLCRLSSHDKRSSSIYTT